MRRAKKLVPSRNSPPRRKLLRQVSRYRYRRVSSEIGHLGQETGGSVDADRGVTRARLYL
jgi:hypothetical protein